MSSSLVAVTVSTLFTLLFALAIIGWLTRGVSDPRRTIGWATAHGLAVTPANRALVTWWSGLSGTLRVVGGVSGVVLGSLFDRAFAVDTSAGVGFWVWVVLGWIAGGMWAWEVVTRTTDAPGQAASLVPRRVEDYVGPIARWAPTAAAVTTVAIAASGSLLAPVTDPRGFPVGSAAERWLLALGAVVLAVLAGWLARHVVARRQASTDPAVVAVDDAIRSTTIHLVIGGATTAILLLAVQGAQLVLQPRQLPFGLRGWVPLLLLAGALVSSRHLANRAWRVRRPGAGPQAVAS